MAKAPKEPRKTSEYVVLARVSGAEEWAVMSTPEGRDRYSATNALDAMKTAAAFADLNVETFVAVPARSWKPKTRNVEQVTKERWS
jgi:hypothetical protein